MKYYSEDDAKHLRLAFEKEVLHWPHVTIKKMFGCLCYQVSGKLFAFLVTGGIVLTSLSPADRAAVSRQHATVPFQAGKQVARNWVQVAVNSEAEVERVLP